MAVSPEQNKTSTVVKQFVVDFSSETYKPLMEHEVNGLDYRYVYSDKARLSVVVQGIENGSASLLDDAGELHAYYHCDYLGTTDYLTSAVNSKVISWTSYSEWGEITHNAVLKCGQRELDLVKEYATHDFDAVLNMYYAKARFYDADNRRFAAVDPILDPSQYDLREYVTDPMQLVQYLYVKDNAVVFIDLDGLKTVAVAGYQMEAIERGGRDYVAVRDLARAYGGGTLEKVSTGRGRTVYYQTKFNHRGETYSFTFTTITNGDKTPHLSVVGNGDSITVNQSKIWNNNNTNYVDVAYFTNLMCKNLGVRKTYEVVGKPVAAVYAEGSGYATANVFYVDLSGPSINLFEREAATITKNKGAIGSQSNGPGIDLGSAEIGAVSIGYDGRVGGFSTDILHAEASAGFNSKLFGGTAKATLVEAAGNINIPIPFTDVALAVNGETGLGVGGEAGLNDKGWGASLYLGLGVGLFFSMEERK